MGPVLVFLIIVAVAPVTLAIIDSFRELKLATLSRGEQFIGLDNYRDLIGSDGKFYSAVGHTAIFMAVVVPIEFVLGMLIALWINREFVGRRLVLTILMIPTMLAPVVVGMIWRFFLIPGFGILTVYLNKFGFFEETSVFSGPLTSFGALMIIDIWEWTPFIFLMILAGLAGLPDEPYEAAELDGASAWQKFRDLTWPFLRPVITITVLLRVMDAFRLFDQVYILTRGGPASVTETLSYYIYKVAFRFFDTGYAAAISLFMLALTVVFSMWFIKRMRLED